jgi:uncharacterized C2H2 Zn-finger protein
MSFIREWSAQCPRCDTLFSHEDITCSNCRREKVKYWLPKWEGDDFFLGQFGCENCGMDHGVYLKCPKCGAVVIHKQIKPYEVEPKTNSRIGCLYILLGIMLFYIFTVGPKKFGL